MALGGVAGRAAIYHAQPRRSQDGCGDRVPRGWCTLGVGRRPSAGSPPRGPIPLRSVVLGSPRGQERHGLLAGARANCWWGRSHVWLWWTVGAARRAPAVRPGRRGPRGSPFAGHAYPAGTRRLCICLRCLRRRQCASPVSLLGLRHDVRAMGVRFAAPLVFCVCGWGGRGGEGRLEEVLDDEVLRLCLACRAMGAGFSASVVGTVVARCVVFSI